MAVLCKQCYELHWRLQFVWDDGRESVHSVGVALGWYEGRRSKHGRRNNGGHNYLLMTSSPSRPVRGFTLIELMVSIGLFAIVMTLSAGAYLIMIGADREAQATTTGIDNLSFALDTMTRSIRTGTAYNCASSTGGDCTAGGSSLWFVDSSGNTITYSLVSGRVEEQETMKGTSVTTTSTLTDQSVTVSSLTFYVSGTQKPPADYTQPYVTIVVTGSVPTGPGKPPKKFTIESSATMRGTDL